MLVDEAMFRVTIELFVDPSIFVSTRVVGVRGQRRRVVHDAVFADGMNFNTTVTHVVGTGTACNLRAHPYEILYDSISTYVCSTNMMCVCQQTH